LYRYGLRRVVGPFAHSICYGYFAMMMLPVAIWLHVTESFSTRWRSWAAIFLCVVGLLLSGSRGALIGAVVAVGLMLILWSPRRNVLLPVTVGAILLGMFLVWPAAQDLMQANRNDGASESAQTAAYRAEMIREYVQICQTSPMFGFGRDNLPVVANMKSIDNQYLWLSLNFGFPAAGLLVLIALVGIVTQTPSVFLRLPTSPWCRFDAVLIGVLAGALGVQATAFAGTQTEQIFFLFVGMSGAPKFVNFTLGARNVRELPALVSGALYPVTPVSRALDWWRRNVIYARAEHGPLPPEVPYADKHDAVAEDVGIPIPFTCETCVQYPPYEYEDAASPANWFVRLYRRIACGEKRTASLKPVCRECGQYRHCKLAHPVASDRREDGTV
jgi:hypothetical protein